MDSMITAAARALAGGDPIGALKRVALRTDPPALALRGIAMAQLGEYPRARELLRRAARGFGSQETPARARCVVAEAEVALAMRDLGSSPRTLAAAAAALERRGDRTNAVQARLVAVRRLVLLGRLEAAQAELARVDADGMAPSLYAVAELTRAELALRALRIDAAQAALVRAREAASRAGIPALQAEVADIQDSLERPAARLLSAGSGRALRLSDVQTLLDSGALVIDACRRGVRMGSAWQTLARRPVLFALARALGEAWPSDADREGLIARAFRIGRPDETHRARLRVEMGRLRTLLAPFAAVEATARGFVLKPRGRRAVAVLAAPVEGERAALVALLSDGAAWSTSALALALGESQRSVQRALAELQATGQARSIGRARTHRWLARPLAGFTPILLLPAALPPP